MTRVLATGAATVALLFTGVLHGLWTDRWAAAEDLDADLARLAAVPLAVGQWEGTDLRRRVRPGGEALASLERRYVHRGTGQVVTVLLACGRPGPVAIHTPEVCYAAGGYEVEPPARFHLADSADEFFTARLQKTRAAGRTSLRIFWSWNGGDGWRVDDNPRLAFAGRPRLVKLYLVREMARPDEPPDRDPCAALLAALLPELRRGPLGPSGS